MVPAKSGLVGSSFIGIDQRTMLTVFTGHRHQAHFEFNIDRFLRSLSLPRGSPDRPHPCLMNAIYLFASHFSRSSHLSVHDGIFLARSRAGITAALQTKDRILHAIQAACIVSFYLFFKGKVLEGYWMSGATCRMAIACGLHQIKAAVSSDLAAPSTGASPIVNTGTKMIVLPEPKNNIELGERIHTFWQVWCVDKYGVLSTGFAPSLVDTPDIPLLKIKTCWPPAMRAFINESISSIQYKVMELWVRAANLRRQGPSRSDFPKHFREIEAALTRVERMIPPLSYYEDGDTPPTESMPIHTRMILPHAMIHATKINLHTTLSNHDSRSYDKALAAANEIMNILEGITHYDFNYLEVVLAVCFKHASETFMSHIERLQRRNDPDHIQAIQTYQNQADATTMAMKRICHLYAATGEPHIAGH
ncbi:uncharacterized protein EI90DRAFT_49727 [Cantharellus anzutake]|uniref:uncharacterized protein n=1 Tax=Cantharellus anzutake TaxID=1750568 RepID=UPI001907DB9E|nr:uncharacterized protein EI90DRAFT_49727 [Cantharellus anzutake]KAF8344134.1 hypothetical protein EI90DRAFT_49727 [Cantharellus anzutake]